MTEAGGGAGRLSRERQELLRRLLRPAGVPPGDRIPPRQGSGPIPATSAQERMFFMDQLGVDSAYHNIVLPARLRGSLDAGALRRGLDELVRRHEALRTTFALEDGRPLQVVGPPAPHALTVHDLRHLPAAEREGTGRRLIVEDAQRPFDLLDGPLFRSVLVRVGDEEHLLLLNFHHTVDDAASLRILFGELSSLYAAFREDRPSPLAPPPIQYGDYAVWQRERLREGRLEHQVEHWRERLRGTPALLQLPRDRPRPAVMSHRGASFRFHLATAPAAVRELGHRLGVTPFVVLLAAFGALLSRCTGQLDVAVGTSVPNRDRPELMAAVGLFLNTLVLRMDLAGGPSFQQLVDRVRKVVEEAFVNAEVPFARLVKELLPERTLSYSPLFQVMFEFIQDAPGEAMQLGGLAVEHLAGVDSGTAKFDLSLVVQEHPSWLEGTVEYSTDLFEAATVQRMMRHYDRLLDAAVAGPDRPVLELPLLDPAERDQLLAWSEGGGGGEPAAGRLNEVVARQAARRPDAPAVSCEGETLSYGELARRAGRLAQRLREAGAGPEARVGLLLEPSTAMVTALLAVLRAGAACVPLDPEHPPRRLAWLVRDAGVELVVTRRRLRGLVPEGAAVVTVETPVEDDPPHPDPPAPGGSAQSLAQVVYTSGSTGRPKGVMVTHANLLRLFGAADAWMRFAETDVWTMFHSAAFDFSSWEVWGALLHGGRVVVVPRWVARTPEAFWALVRAERVTVLSQTPSAFRQLQQVAEGDHSLRAVILGGEALEPSALRAWADRFGLEPCRLVNMYGITETTVHVTHRPLGEADVAGGSVSPIGRPLADLRVHVLDGRLEPVPVNVVGEMYVGGAGVTRGYLGRPGLTAERFVPDPFGGHGRRLYRSGDLARWTAAGELEYAGRADQQVKVRGHRIEPAEVTSALERHPGVTAAAVVAHEDRLAAYVAGSASAAELRAHLRSRLPEHMVPAWFVPVERLPLTPNGKLDRGRLPAPEPETRGYVAPRTPEEEVLSRLWAEVLGARQVGVEDDFFELGGDSILSMQIAARAQRAGLRLTPRQVFEHRTVAAIARAAAGPAAPGETAAAAPGPVPLTPIQRRFFDGDPVEPRHFVQARQFRLPGPPDADALRDALAAVLARHEAFRLRFRRDPGGWRQLLAEAAPQPEIVRASLSGDGDELSSAVAELAGGLDLSEGRLVAAALVTLEREVRLVLVVHHLVVDVVSWSILVDELERAYRGGELGPPPVGFAAWSRRLSEHVASGALDGEAAYWSFEVEGPAGRVPAGGEAGDLVGSEQTAWVRLEEDLTRDLLGGGQVHEALLAAVAVAVSAWTGDRAVRLEVEGHGREPLPGADPSRSVGWFTSLYPVRIDLPVGGPLAAHEAVLRKLRTVPGRGVGYGLLRYLRDGGGGAAGLAPASPVEVAFNYVGQLDAGREGGWLQPVGGLGGQRSPRQRREHLVEVTALVRGGQLWTGWSYGRGLHRPETLRRVTGQFLGALRAIARRQGEQRRRVARLLERAEAQPPPASGT